MPSYKLTYFDVQGLGEAIRLAFHCGGIPFTDERLTHEQFGQKKESYPFGQLPVLTVDDKTVIPQSGAILLYVGRLSGLYPTDREEATKVDIIVNLANDFYANHVVFYGPEFPGKDVLKQTVIEEKIPKLLGYLEKYLAANGTTYSAGEKLTVADFRLYSIIGGYKSGALAGIPTALVDKYPHVTKLYQAIDSHEKISSWNKSRAK